MSALPGRLDPKRPRAFTVGHGARPAAELVAALRAAGVGTVVDVRRFPSSRRHPQFNRKALADALATAGIGYRHLLELGGRRSGEPGEERFGCIEVAGFRSYVARMGRPEFQAALAEALAEPAPCFTCAETLWWRCHRRFISELLTARGYEVVHLIPPDKRERHPLLPDSEIRNGKLYLCGELVA